MTTDINDMAVPAPVRAKGPLIYRQSIFTRVTHWVWVVCLFFLLASGLNIFNAHPTLYIGQQSSFPDLQTNGQHFDDAWLDIGAVNTDNGPRGQTTILGKSFDTTGGCASSMGANTTCCKSSLIRRCSSSCFR